MTQKNSTDDVVAVEAHSEIKEILGKEVELSKVFSKEKIIACQKIINSAKNNFFDTAKKELSELKKLLKSNIDSQNDDEDIIKPLASIRSQAETLGFILITQVCDYIIKYYESETMDNKKRIRIIDKLVDTLKLAFDQKIKDDGGPLGKELLLNLRKIK